MSYLLSFVLHNKILKKHILKYNISEKKLHFCVNYFLKSHANKGQSGIKKKHSGMHMVRLGLWAKKKKRLQV